MSEPTVSALAIQARARRAYESGRLAFALRRAVWLVPLVWLASSGCSEPAAILAGGAGLVAAVTFCLWRGEAWRRGVAPGLLAGSIPMLAPTVLHAARHVCTGGVCLLMPTLCILAGIAGGLALGALAPRPREAGGAPFLSACLIAGFAGSVGCLIYGTIGVGAMTLGLLAGATPVLAVRRPR